MTSTEIKRREIGERFDLQSSQKHVFQLPGTSETHVLEFDDAHFHEESAVLLPDPNPTSESGSGGEDRITGITLLASCYRYAEKNKDQTMLVAGHAVDGEPNPSSLSQRRAENVWAALKGDRDDWVDVADEQHTVEDYQKILKWIATSRGWDCDPGPIDDILGPKTKSGIEGFQRVYNRAFDASIWVDGIMGPQTWSAIFDVYMETLQNVLETDEEGLQAYRRMLRVFDPRCDAVGCGTAHPVPSDWSSDYRSQTDLRVETFFFAPGDEPRIDDPLQDPDTPPQSDLFDPEWYDFSFISHSPSATIVEARVEIKKVEGLYKPGHNNDEDKGHNKQSGYKEGYKSKNDRGRIFINHKPFSQSSNDWQLAWERDTQYIELTAKMKDVTPDALPADARVVWEWKDPDDPTDKEVKLDSNGKTLSVREEAGQYLDPSDYSFEKSDGEWKAVNKETANDNRGQCDHSVSDSGSDAKFEEVGSYTMEDVGDRKCETAIEKKKSKVRLHCTNVGGDNFTVRVQIKPHPAIKVKKNDEEYARKTGVMTMWKRIDVEYRCMPGAKELPVDEIPKYFEPAFVQLDLTKEQEARPKLEYMGETYSEFKTRRKKYVKAPPKGVFEHEYDPGWFLLVSAHKGVKKLGPEYAKRVYDSRIGTTARDGKVKIEVPFTQSDKIAGHNIYRSTSRFRDVSGAKKVNTGLVGTDSKYVDANVTNGTTYHYRLTKVTKSGDEMIWSHVFEATPGHSSSSTPEEKPYFQVHKEGGDIWEKVVVPELIDERVFAVRLFDDKKSEYVRVEEKEPDTPKSGKTTLHLDSFDHQSDFEPGNGLLGDPGEGGAMHRSVEYYPRHKLIHPAKHWISGGYEFSDTVHVAVETPGGLKIGGVSPPNVHGGREYFAGRTIVFTTHPGYKEMSKEERQKKMLSTIVHEFTHAFGFPHKCGYYTFVNPSKSDGSDKNTSKSVGPKMEGCSMNYYNTWVYAAETWQKYVVQSSDDGLEQIALDHGLDRWREIYYHPRNDHHRKKRSPNELYPGDVLWLPNSRSIQRFNVDSSGQEIDDGIHLCAQHIDGIRRVHLEDNPALWHP